MLYALTVFGNTWGFPGYKEKEASYHQGDMEVLKRLQNKVTRLTLGETGHDLPTGELLKHGNILIVHQLSMYNTVVKPNKAMISGRPDFVAKKCSKLLDTRTQQGALREELSRLSIRAESFLPKHKKN